ncbi:COA3 [[Candida] subhashii]|uniref:Cytochrome c oxidase assembly factor 3 n=1 Tax=[Candida] subhashii TaxID=561895 RepID=A0A8J5QMV9_9ASCO|nr:COA3 [[Candida] subhashii]KAG7663315.1 COA3 [[Candida] subhashii]
MALGPKGHDRYRNPYTQQMTPALYRVRAPFFWRNVAGLIVFSAIPAAVYGFTYYKMTADEFDDIPIPPISDEELKKLKVEYEASKAAAAAENK